MENIEVLYLLFGPIGLSCAHFVFACAERMETGTVLMVRHGTSDATCYCFRVFTGHVGSGHVIARCEGVFEILVKKKKLR